MLNRTITILPVFLVIVLGIVVGFAVLGLRGPERELRDARHAIEREDFAGAIRHLNRVKNEIGLGDTDLQEKSTRMRALTYERLGNRRKAVQDLKFLIDDLQVHSGGLVRDRIRLLNEIGAEESDVTALDQALRYCKRWLASNREDGIALGLAGHSRQILANVELAEWKATFEKQVPHEHRDRIHELINRAIYSTNPASSLALEIDRMSEKIDGFVPGFSQTFFAKVEHLRKIAQTARGWFLKGLSSQHSDPTAYEGIASQLRIARDDDSLLMMAHAHLSRVKTRDSYSAAFDIADIHLRHKRYQACIEIAGRVLPVEHIRPCFHDGTLNYKALKLIACHAVALSQIGKRKDRQKLMHAVGSISYKKRPPYPRIEARPFPLTHFVLGMLIDDKPSIEAHLDGFSKKIKTDFWFDERLAGYAFRRLATVIPPERSDEMYVRWMHYRPGSVQPIHGHVKVLLSRGDVTGANRELNRAIQKLSNPDLSLELLIETQLRTSGLDLAEVTERASELGKTVPDEVGAFPALTIALARQALSTRHVSIALACTVRAKNLFPRSRIPYYLHANTLIAGDDPGQAARVIELYLKQHPDDQRALQILAKARNAAGRSTDDLRYGAILNGTPDLLSSRYLAHQWLTRGEYQRVLTLASSATRDFGIDLEMQVLATRALMLDSTAARNEVLTMLRAVFHLSRGVQNPTSRQQQLANWALGQYALYNPEQLTPAIRRVLLTEFLRVNRSPENLLELAEQLTERLDFELALRCYRDLAQDNRYKDFRQAIHFVTAARLALRLDDTTKARELLAAAMAFNDSSQATLELALLDLAQGEEPSLAKDLIIDSVLAAGLAARQNPELVVPFLAKRLKANPNDLACQCIAAVLSEQAKVSPHVRTLATNSGPNLLSLVALLEQPPFGRLAKRFAETIADENPLNPAAQLLLAKANGNAGQAIELQAIFDKIRNQIGADVVLITAAFQVLSETRHPALQHSKIKDQLAALALRNGANTPPALLALVLKQNSAILQVPGARDKILPMVKGFWLAFPRLSGVGLGEVAMLVHAGSHRDAINLLRKIEPLLPADQRSEYLALYYRAASAVSETSTPAARNRLIAEALRRLKSGEIHGAPLHFLLGWLDRALEASASTDQQAEIGDQILSIEGRFLQQHLEECPATTETHMHFLQLSLERLANKRGYDRAMQFVDAVLRRDPSLIPIWRLRSRWLVQLSRVTEATKSLLWMPQYLDSPEILDILIQLLARSGQLVEKGQEVLSMKNLATASKLSLGLVELRLGQYQTAVKTLSAAETQRDGAHLYYRALALLSLQIPETLGLAKIALQELVDDYRNSNYHASAKAVLTVL